MKDTMIIQCPHCDNHIEILEINCGIFRHGAYKRNNRQLPPHMSEADCKKAVANDEIYGCGMPFRVIKKDTVIVEKCDYI